MKKISGVGKRHLLKNFFKRINTPYDLRIHDVIDGEEMLHLALTKKSVYLLVSTFIVGSFLILSLLFLFTPIKYYIPGYETTDSRRKLVQLSNKIDSLENYQKSYKRLLGNVVAVTQDEENYLLDTNSLNKGELSAAEMSNINEITTKDKKASAIRKDLNDSTGAIKERK